MNTAASYLFRKAPALATKKEVHDLVVLIHGFGGTKYSFLPIAAAISSSSSDEKKLGRAVLNYGYKTRSALLHEHSDQLIDVVADRVRQEQVRHVHFVTHSFGGVVLRCAFGRGLGEALPSKQTRSVLIAPPLRGVMFGRQFEHLELGARVLPDSARKALRAAARAYVGKRAGMQILTKPPEWFEKAGAFPQYADVLVIEGKLPVEYHPLIGSESSDGIVTGKETFLSVPHRRSTVAVPHNLMMIAPSVATLVRKHLDGIETGQLHPGCPLSDDEAPLVEGD